MPKAQSDTIPEPLIKSAGKTQVNYNIHEVINDDGTHYEYNYVVIEGKVTKAKILAALEGEQKENDQSEWTPDETVTQYNDAKSAISLSNISQMTYTQLDTYIDDNVTNLTEAKNYLKKLSKVVLALVKKL